MKQHHPFSGTAAVAGRPLAWAGARLRLARLPTGAGGESSTSRAATRLAWGLWALSLLLNLGSLPLRYQLHVVASAPGLLLPPQDIAVLQGSLLDVINDVFAQAAFLAYSTMGALIVSRAREPRIGWLFCAISLLFAINHFAEFYAVYALLAVPGSLPAGLAAGWLQHWDWIVDTGLLLIFLPLLYPTGRLLSPRWRPVGWLSAGVIALLALGLTVSPGPLINIFLEFQTRIPNPLGIAALGQFLEVAATILFLLFLLLTLVAATSLLVRLRWARGSERQQLKWFAYLAAIMVVLFATYNLSNIFLPSLLLTAVITTVWTLFYPLVAAALPLFTGLAILRYRLYDIDRLINRTLVYTILLICIVSVYVLIVGGLGVVFQASGSPLLAILATGLVALLFHPLRQRVQRGINRLLYGERDEPSTVLSRLGSRLEATLVPEAVLPTIVQTVQEALRLPYAAITLAQGETFEVAASAGQQVADTFSLPLVYQGEAVGQLVVGARTPGEAFSGADRKVLQTIAYQAGAAVHTAHLTSALQRSRQHLVTTREEERRRLRRDLHDGLGPVLATIALQAEAARDQLPAEGDQSTASLTDLIAQAHGALDDIRRLVYALRPPALDALGLVGALKEQVTKIARADLAILVDAPECLPPLPAAVEVAAYRILQEALTNVVRHAGARTCTVSIQVNDTLDLAVRDDGCGVPADCHAGVGLPSMRERAAELGGTCEITSPPGQGTCLRVSLPRQLE